MTKALCSFPEEERRRLAAKRVAGGTYGLGYWAAVDYEARKGKEPVKKKVEKKEEGEEDAS